MSGLFLDSNVLVEGICSDWGLSKVILSLCAVRIHQMILAEDVKDEVERSLLMIVYSGRRAERVLTDYDRFIALARPQIVPSPGEEEIFSARHLIRHQNDVPILVAALNSRLDWLIINNREHFTLQVAMRTGLRIASPFEFFQIVHSSA
jgi:hypothetical protein